MTFGALLETVGVHGSGRDLYLKLVQEPSLPPAVLGAECGLEPDDAEALLAELENCGLVRKDPGGDWHALPPDRVLSRVLEDEEQRAAERLKRLSELRDSLPDMMDHYLTPRCDTSEFSPTTTLHTADAVRTFLYRASQTATNQVRTMLPGEPLTPEATEASLASDLLLLGRGVRVQMVVTRESLNVPHWHEYLVAIQRAGGEVRLHGAPPMLMVLFDDETLVIPRAERRGACALTSSDYARPALELFEQVWLDSVELQGNHGEGQGAVAYMDARMRQVLLLLAQGNTDAAIARRLGLSIRTIRRLVANLCDQLHAHSRFEAGVLAARRGWVPGGGAAHPPE